MRTNQLQSLIKTNSFLIQGLELNIFEFKCAIKAARQARIAALADCNYGIAEEFNSDIQQDSKTLKALKKRLQKQVDIQVAMKADLRKEYNREFSINATKRAT